MTAQSIQSLWICHNLTLTSLHCYTQVDDSRGRELEMRSGQESHESHHVSLAVIIIKCESPCHTFTTHTGNIILSFIMGKKVILVG